MLFYCYFGQRNYRLIKNNFRFFAGGESAWFVSFADAQECSEYFSVGNGTYGNGLVVGIIYV